MAGPRSAHTPPLSFVRRYLQKTRESGRVDAKFWRKMLDAWKSTHPARRKEFEQRPLMGLHLPRGNNVKKKNKNVAVAATAIAPIVHSHTRSIHEVIRRSNRKLPGEHLETAKAALLQLNVMVAQGIEPDAEMYTSLIVTVGKARLEWQAFKLFSRMLEQGIKPLPETYLALKQATNWKRKRVIEQIEAKMREAALALPDQLSNTLREQREADERAADRSLRQLREKQQQPINDEIRQQQEEHEAPPQQRAHDNDNRREKIREMWQQEGSDIPTMRIDSIEAVMETIKHIDARQRHGDSVAKGEQRTSLLKKLEKLHEEELRIVLTIHRQSRHGTREQLLRRVISQVPADYLEQMFERRSHYFDSVKQVLEVQMEELKEHEHNQRQQQQQGGETQLEKSSNINSKNQLALDKKRQDLAQIADGGAASALATTDGDNNVNALNDEDELVLTPTDASQLTQHERFMLSPPYVDTPWGLLRRPPRPPPNITHRNPDRDAALRLTDTELNEMRSALTSGAFDTIPQHMLRRYARHFHLKWNRRASKNSNNNSLAQLQDLVEWHMRNFKAINEDGAAGPLSSSSAIEQQQQTAELDAAEEDRRAQQQTLDQYNALVAVARVTENMTMVDDASVSRAVIRERGRERYENKVDLQQTGKERYAQRMRDLDQGMRSMPNNTGKNNSSNTSSSSTTSDEFAAIERELLQRQLSSSSQQQSRSSNLLGLEQEEEQPEAKASVKQQSSSSHNRRVQELPPWEALSTPTPFNLRTGKFDVGVPKAEYYEDSTGKLRVRQPHLLKNQFSVDEKLLPTQHRARIRQERWEQQELEEKNREIADRQQKFREKSFRAGRFTKFVEKAKGREKLERDAQVKPLRGVPQRMSRKLRVGEVPDFS